MAAIWDHIPTEPVRERGKHFQFPGLTIKIQSSVYRKPVPAVVSMTHYIISALATEMFSTLQSINRKTFREQKINYLQVASKSIIQS